MSNETHVRSIISSSVPLSLKCTIEESRSAPLFVWLCNKNWICKLQPGTPQLCSLSVTDVSPGGRIRFEQSSLSLIFFLFFFVWEKNPFKNRCVVKCLVFCVLVTLVSLSILGFLVYDISPAFGQLHCPLLQLCCWAAQYARWPYASYTAVKNAATK